MPSAFIQDLIDHKRRVSRHMQTMVSLILERNTVYGGTVVIPDDDKQLTLVDLLDVACAWWRGSKRFPFSMDGQLGEIVQSTQAYLATNQAPDVAHQRGFVIIDLFQRAAVHDNSKFSHEEFAAYDAAFPDLQKYAYGTDEFKTTLAKIQPAIAHHYRSEDHHPEHFEGGISQMHVGQLIEMVCDWLAASERSQKNIHEGLDMNRQRFNIDRQLFSILKNTVNQLAIRDAGRSLRSSMTPSDEK